MSTVIDESRRFVAPADATLTKNLAALWATDPKLAEALERLDGAAYPTMETRDGLPTVARTAADGRTLLMHSRHRPLEEADRQIESADCKTAIFFYVLGIGLGYHLQALMQKASEEAITFVIEPDLRMIRTAIEHRDLSEMILGGRVAILHEPDKADFFSKLNPHTAVISIGNAIISHPASLQLHEEYFRSIKIWIDEFAAFVRTSMNTLVMNSTRTAENIARNIGWYVAAPSLERLRNRWHGKPAIIVSAGPSLRKNKHLLNGAREHAVLIAVQTTFAPLLEMGVEPHYVTSLDYHDICARFFEKIPPGVGTELVAEPKATNLIFDMHRGPLTLLGNEFAESLLRELNSPKPTLRAGATVAHLAFYLAEHMGCDPIIFVGQDLGFSDGLCYTPGTSYEQVWRPELGRFCTLEMKQWDQIIRDKRILRRVPDISGGTMYTEERLFTYLQQFERDFGASKSRIIDATEGGVRKRHSTTMMLAEAIRMFCGEPLGKVEDDYPGLHWDQIPQVIECLEIRQREATEIEKIGRNTLPLLEEIYANLEDQGLVNRNIARLDLLRSQMNELGRTYDMVLQLSQETELKRFQSDRRLAAEKLTGLDKQRRQAERDVENVKAVIEAAIAFGKLMSEVMSALANQPGRVGTKLEESPCK